MELLSVGKLSPTVKAWATRVRVAYLSPVRYWSSARGDGHVLAAEFVGDDGVHIRACAFDETAKKLASVLTFNGVYRVGNAALRSAKPAFKSVPHPFEIVLSADATIESLEDDSDTAETAVTITRIRDLATTPIGATVNVCGIVSEIGEIQYIQNRRGGAQHKRDILISDASNTSVRCAMWDDYTDDQLGEALHSSVLAYQCRLTEYGGRSLFTLRSSMVALDPPMADADTQRSWFTRTLGENCVPLPLVDCHFTRLADISKLPGGQLIAVVRVITRVEEVGTVLRNNQQVIKRVVTIEDADHVTMKCTLWQEDAERITMDAMHHVLAIERGKVDTYAGAAVGASFGSTVMLDPPIPVSLQLQAMFCEDPVSFPAPGAAETTVTLSQKPTNDVDEVAGGCGQRPSSECEVTPSGAKKRASGISRGMKPAKRRG